MAKVNLDVSKVFFVRSIKFSFETRLGYIRQVGRIISKLIHFINELMALQMSFISVVSLLISHGTRSRSFALVLGNM